MLMGQSSRAPVGAAVAHLLYLSLSQIGNSAFYLVWLASISVAILLLLVALIVNLACHE